MKNISTRNESLINKVVFTDGQPGCGKTLFTSLISTLKRIEIFNFSAEIENICALNYLNKIDNDAVISLLKIQMDLDLYELMMSRRLNFRPTDLSSALQSLNLEKYIGRLFFKGDSLVPNKIIQNKPISHYLTHNLLSYSKPIFESFPGKIFFIEIVRHPIYQVIQQSVNHKNWMKKNGTARQFHLYLKKNNKQYPFWAEDYASEFLNANNIERAILDMHYMTYITNQNKKTILSKYKKNILTISFENFVFDPFPYIQKISKLLGTTKTKSTIIEMKKQNVPRKKIPDGINLEVYKRYGWKAPIDGYSELEELELRKNYVIKSNIKKKYLDILDGLSLDYENTYLKNFFK